MSMPLLPERGLRRSTFILAGLSFSSVLVYLLFSRYFYRIGFPLDDAWIHQTYARNLALRGEWAFLPGQPSGGSTSPLWSALLVLGYWLGLDPFGWTYLLGAGLLLGLALMVESALRQILPSYRSPFPWAGAAISLEWHLVWAAGSGMETMLHAMLVTAILLLLMRAKKSYLLSGLLIGFCTWARPDGLTLLGPLLLTFILAESRALIRLRGFLDVCLGFGILFVPYLLFNLMMAGSPWPSTFYAKQAEYAALQEIPFLERFASLSIQPLVGMGLALLPGALLWVVSASRRRDWGSLACIAWLVGYLFLYAWRLPVTYQHGRYIIPAMPIFFTFGLAGMLDYFSRPNPSRLRWMMQTFWRVAVGVIALAFWVRGAGAYAQDVAVIESEMVAAAQWVAENLPSGTLVAAHDIGALGYYGGHDLVDLAGLVSPDVIPFIRDEIRLAAYLDERGVQYLVAFPDWYPLLTRDLQPLYITRASFAPALGQENMTIYKWRQW